MSKLTSEGRRRIFCLKERACSGICPEGAVDWLAESIVYVCSVIPDRPRAIDRYIDYFGEGAET